MDLNDDLCRTDFYDFINPKLEPGTTELTPVAFIDSVDYINSVTDSNNNLGVNGSTSMKSFLDEMLFNESNGGHNMLNGNHSTSNSSPSTTNGDEIVGLPSISSTFELMGFQWSGLNNNSNNNGNNNIMSTDSNSDNNVNNSHNHWISSENEVTTLTNLLDPLFVSYDNDDISPLNCGNSKIQYFTTNTSTTSNNRNSTSSNNIISILGLSTSMSTSPTMVSSDQITTTFHNDHTSKSYVSSPSETIILNGRDHELNWQKQDSPNSPFIYCDESLLRSALQTGKLDGSILNSGNINLNITTAKTNNSNSTMTELRKVLDYPPLSVNSDTSSTQSPSSTSTTSPTPTSNLLLDNSISNLTIRQPPYFEFKILDPMFNTQIETIIIDESNIPNVEELIMTRIDNNKNSKKMGISEPKINSTTLSTKWTYTTNATSKTPKRRRTKQAVAAIKQEPNSNNSNINNINNISSNEINIMMDTNNENSISHSSENSRSPSDNNNNNNGTSRKERSLHYCNICNKGFKDKYSVNVHVRTHTGEKPFGCFCGKHFRQKAHLAKHHQTHAAKANGHTGKGKRATS